MPHSYLLVYAFFLIAAGIIYSLAYLIYVYGSMRASRIIHKVLIESVLGTTLRYVPRQMLDQGPYVFDRWLDKTPTSRVIARCTQDIRAGMIMTTSAI
jgi:hypothetical protein